MKWILATVMLLIATSGVVAQPRAPMPDPEGSRRERIHERIESMRIWKLTEALDLDPEKAAIFFPRYRLHIMKLDSLEKKRQATLETIRVSIDENSELDFRAEIETLEQLTDEIHAAQRAFLRANGDLLSERDMAALVLFEHRFHQRLRDVVRDLRREHPFPGPPDHEKPMKMKKR